MPHLPPRCLNCVGNKPVEKPIRPGRDGNTLPVYSYQARNSEPLPIFGLNVQFNSGQNSFDLNTIDPQPLPSSTYKINGLGILPQMQIELYIREKRNIQVLGHDETNRLIGSRLIRPPVTPNKSQSGVLEATDHSVARSMTAQPLGSRLCALQVAAHDQQATGRVCRGSV